jgi:hypothetical protein
MCASATIMVRAFDRAQRGLSFGQMLGVGDSDWGAGGMVRWRWRAAHRRAIPFTAARARNEGFERVRRLAPDVSHVQFAVV